MTSEKQPGSIYKTEGLEETEVPRVTKTEERLGGGILTLGTLGLAFFMTYTFIEPVQIKVNETLFRMPSVRGIYDGIIEGECASLSVWGPHTVFNSYRSYECTLDLTCRPLSTAKRPEIYSSNCEDITRIVFYTDCSGTNDCIQKVLAKHMDPSLRDHWQNVFDQGIKKLYWEGRENKKREEERKETLEKQLEREASKKSEQVLKRFSGQKRMNWWQEAQDQVRGEKLPGVWRNGRRYTQ